MRSWYPGDVLLLEAQVTDRATGDKLWPVEIKPIIFQSIELAVACGIIVVEPAGNGHTGEDPEGNNLDQFPIWHGKNIFGTSEEGFRDSGAILVGAASSNEAHGKIQSSNYGSRIDCFAWGENVYSSSLPPDQFDADFKSTSSAAAIIAGAAISVQSINKGKNRRPLSPSRIRQILSDQQHGTTSRNNIGAMPDLEYIIKRLFKRFYDCKSDFRLLLNYVGNNINRNEYPVICFNQQFFIYCCVIGTMPRPGSLWKRLIFLRDSGFELSPAEKLKELLIYNARIKNCNYRDDSTHALLMQRIGAMYFYQSDFLNAARYMRQATNIITINAGKASVNIRHNIRNYYSLAWIYDSLDNVSGKMEALDSCVAVALRCRSSDIYAIRALSVIGEYWYDMGDYHRCNEYAQINERVAREYATNSHTKTEQLFGLQFSLWSLFLKINALIMLQEFEMAEQMLIARIDECKKNGLNAYLGTIYQQLAKVQLKKTNGERALVNYNQAFKYEKEAGDNIACMSVLNQIGYEVYFKWFHDADKSLSYCRKALTYVGKNKLQNMNDVFVLLNVLTNIGNIYAGKGLYDSAFTYFQFAFDQLKPGMNELELLYGSTDEFSKE